MTTTLAELDLNQLALGAALSDQVRFDRSQLERRILHIGPGAFFRAHQADYVDRLNALDPGWGITGLSLRSNRLARALGPQDGLYSLVTLGRTIETRVIASLLEVLDAADTRARDTFLAPELRLITLTITEKGYCLDAAGQLDLDHADIQTDLATPDAPASALGWLLRGLNDRRRLGLSAPIVLSCDNLVDNGKKLHAALHALAEKIDSDLRDWIDTHCRFPCCMVDSITPATEDATRQIVRDSLGVEDRWPVQREVFTQWVIETVGDDARMPPFDQVGASFTDNVKAFEQAKLRLLNGAHSTLAYYGLACGFATVAEAMADTEMRAFIRILMRDEIAPSLSPPDGLDLEAYCDDLIERFANPSIDHKLSQIAWDGSQKLPIRLLRTVSDNLACGRSVDGLAIGVAAWWRFVIRQTRTGADLVDPIAHALQARAGDAADHAEPDIANMLAIAEIFPAEIAASARFRTALVAAYATIMEAE